MKTLFCYLTLLFSSILIGQNTYLHCGKLIDTKNGKILDSKTIVVAEDRIISIEDGYKKSNSSLVNVISFPI